MKISCLAWAPFSDRMDELSKSVGGSRKNIHAGYLPRYLSPLKYLAFFFLTQLYLFRERPDVVYAQNPPAFCPLACVPYAKATGRLLVVDHHNVWSQKTFGGSRLSGQFRAVERVLALFADVNTVPHALWKRALETLGSRRVITVHDYVPRNESTRDEELRKSISDAPLIGIASGHQGDPLERIESEALGAEEVGGVFLAVTGPPERVGPRMKSLGALRHSRFLGYLPKAEYSALKASCDFGLNITDEPYTVNHILFEYAAASLPTISTRKPEIEAVFGDSLAYVDGSDPRRVAMAIDNLARDTHLLEEYRTRIAAKFSELTSQHEKELALLLRLISSK